MSVPLATLVHATTLSFNDTAVLIRGRSGAGKSDLALQLLESAGTGLTGSPIRVALVADDQTELQIIGNLVFASAPPSIRGLLEVRGQGLLKISCIDNVRLAMVVELAPAAEIERLPEAHQLSTIICGKAFPLLRVDPSLPSAAARVRTGWAQLVDEAKAT